MSKVLAWGPKFKWMPKHSVTKRNYILRQYFKNNQNSCKKFMMNKITKFKESIAVWVTTPLLMP